MIRTLFWASRPVSWVNTAYPFAAAAILTGGLPAWLVVLGVVFFLVPYNLLMYGINDVFDYESDLRNPRKGGVEGIVLASRWHRLTLWWAVTVSSLVLRPPTTPRTRSSLATTWLLVTMRLSTPSRCTPSATSLRTAPRTTTV